MASDAHEDLRQQIADQEGVGDATEDVRGHTEDELRASAIDLRVRLGRGRRHPTIESAIAARQQQREAYAERLWGSQS
jgi:hypothetical protein